MNKSIILLVLIATLGLNGCAGMSQTEQRTMSGTVGGAGAGVILVHSQVTPPWARQPADSCWASTKKPNKRPTRKAEQTARISSSRMETYLTLI